MILENESPRVGIYFIYEENGIIDEYILYQLQDLKKNLSYLFCIVNGRLTTEGRQKLEAVANEVYVRENKGYDIGAYSAAIRIIGWDSIRRFDELVLMNNTCYGPVYPFRECFDWAATKDVDFWGLTMGISELHNSPDDYAKYPFSREHIQSYFMVIRKSLLCSKELQEFMESLPEAKSYSDSGLYFENMFTTHFRLCGFSFATYCDCESLLKLHNNPAILFPVELMREFRYPLVKKKLFTESYADLLTQCVGQNAVEAMEYIEKNCDYDTNLIWDNLLRTQDLSVLVRNCHLLRILPREHCLPAPVRSLSVGVVFHVYYSDIMERTVDYLNCFSNSTEILITTDTEEKKALLAEKLSPCRDSFELRVIENRGRDMSALLIGAADFIERHDLICFSHDKKTSQQKPGSVGVSWAYELSENMFGSREYVHNIIDLFERESRLGIVFPPYPTHSDYAGLATGWVNNFARTKDLLEELGIDVEIHPQTLCVAPLGTNFWFRTDALKTVFKKKWKYSDFPSEPIKTDGTLLHAAERIFAYAAQNAGYYPAFIMNDRYARIEYTNLEMQKLGSQQMASWLHATMEAGIFGESAEEIFQKMIAPPQSGSINYGIKNSLKHLSVAVRNKYPRFWAILCPFRWVVKKLLRV